MPPFFRAVPAGCICAAEFLFACFRHPARMQRGRCGCSARSRRFADVAKVLPYCDEARFFDNDNGFVLVAEYRNGEILPIGSRRPEWLVQLMKEIG